MPQWVYDVEAVGAVTMAFWLAVDLLVGSNRRISAARKEGLALALLRHHDATVALAAPVLTGSQQWESEDWDDERERLTDGECRERAARVRRGNVAALRVR